MKYNSGFWYKLLDATTEGDTGGGAAPATAPPAGGSDSSTVLSNTADASSPGSDVDWEDISRPDDDTTTPSGNRDVPAKTVPSAPAEPLPATPVSTAQTVQPLAQPTVVVQPAVQATEQTPAAVATPSNVAPAVDTKELRAQEVSRLEGFYALDEENARLVLTEPEKVFPKLAASLHMNVVDSVISAVFARLPEAVKSIQSREIASKSNEDAFYSEWPELKDKKYEQAVWQTVAAYRSLNPNASREDLIKAAGLQAMIQLRLPLPQRLFAQQQQVVQTSHTPVDGTAASAPRPPAGPKNPFEVMSEEFLSEDRF